MTKPPPSFGERLQALPLDIKRCERRIDDAFEHKREMLRQYGAASLLAGRARRQLRDLKDLHLDFIEEAKLLEPLAGREQQQQRPQHPTDELSARERLLVIEPWIVKWQAVPENDRSAMFQARLDAAVNERHRLTKLIESFQPRRMTAV